MRPKAPVSRRRGKPRTRARWFGIGKALAARRPCVEHLELRQLLAGNEPFISEFLTANSDGLIDQYAAHSDWIEIHNPGPAMDLGGWYLTDKPGDPTRWWRFEANTTIPSGGYRVVFASEHDIRTGPELHANFKLDKAGEMLALIRPDGSIASSYMPYPAQVEDVSYGMGPGYTATTKAVAPGSGAKMYVPASAPAGGTPWYAPDFDDSAWSDVVLGIGYERGNEPLLSEIEPNNSTAAANNAVYSLGGYSGNLYHMGISGSAGSSADWFKIGNLQTGDVLTVAAAGLGGQRSGGSSNLTVELWRGGAAGAAVLVDADSGPGNDALLPRFTITSNDIYYVVVNRQLTTVATGNYQLGLWLENSGTAPTTGGSFVSERESNNQMSAANDASGSWRPVQYRATTSGTLSSASDVDVLRYQFHEKDLVTVQVRSTSSSATRVSLLDANGAVVALDDGTSAYAETGDSRLFAFVVPGSDITRTATYYVRVEAESGSAAGTYAVDVYLSSPTAPPLPGGYVSYAAQGGTIVGPEMHGRNASAWVRAGFTGLDPKNVSAMTLRMKYDDGFVAYLNGQPIAQRNAPASLAWNSTATGERPNSQAIVYETIDVSQYKDLLWPGDNFLAIQGLNISAGDDDFYLAPELEYTVSMEGGEQYFRTPTPGAANQPGALGKVSDTRFSVNRGYYDQPFDVVLTTSTGGAEIRYTLDGTNPTESNGLVYQGPIRITKTTTLKAAAFKAGYIPTDVDAQTYLFLDNILAQNGAGLPTTWGSGTADYAMDSRIVNANSGTIRDDLRSLPVVSLSMPINDWFAAQGGIYPQGNGDPRQTSMEFFTADGTEQVQINGSVEVQGGGYGGTSADRWKTYKLSLQMKFKEIYGDPKLKAQLFGAGTANSFDTLILDAQINHTWLHPGADQQTTAKLIQDQYMADVQNAMGGYGPHGRFVHLYLNGLYWGVYDLHERPDEKYAAEYLGGDASDYVVIKHGLSNPSNDPAAGPYYQSLLNLVRADMTNLANYRAVEGVLDVDEFIDYMLVNFYGGNHDWAAKNWYATRNTVDPNGKWRFHSWDAEHVLEDINANVTTYNNSGGPTEIHSRLKASTEYRIRFADRVRKHFFDNGAMTPARTAALYQARMDEVNRAMIAESARWGDNRSPSDPYTREDWLATQNGLLANFFPGRTNVLLGQLRSQGLYPAIEAPAFSSRGGAFAGPQTLTITSPGGVGTVYYTTDGTDPRSPGGGVSPAARSYSGPITVSSSSQIRARIFGSEWSAQTDAIFHIGPPPALRITEVMYHPADAPTGSPYTGEDFEFVELLNSTGAPLNVGGYQFTNGIDFRFPAGTVLDAGERVVLAKDAAAFALRYGSLIEVMGVYGGQLNNSGGRLTLATHLGQVIQSFEFGGSWWSHVDGGGFSLVPLDPMAGDGVLSTSAGWRPSARNGGSPGADETGIRPGSILINEVMTYGDAPEGDWIELVNVSATDIDISGWAVSNALAKLDKFVFPAGTWLRSGEYLLLNERDHFGNAGAAGVNEAFSLDRVSDFVYLTEMAAGEPAGYREMIDFAGAELNVSFGRYPKSTGSADITAMSRPTPGSANAAPAVGPVVISEIMYLPATGGDEFIELKNLTDQAIALNDGVNGWSFRSGISYLFKEGEALAPQGYALVVGIDPDVFRTRHSIPSQVPVFGPFEGDLDASGEKLTLSRTGTPDGTRVPYIVVDRVHYGSEAPWPTSPYGTGPSLMRKRMGDYGNDVSNWAAGPVGGTPGGSGAISIAGSASADSFYVRRSPAGDTLQIYLNNPTLAGQPNWSYALDEARTIAIDAGAGDDLLILDMIYGVPALAGGITFNGGAHSAAGDALTLKNAAGGGAWMPATTAGSATLLMGSAAVSVSGIESAAVRGAMALRVVTPGANDVLAMDSAEPNANTLRGTSGAVSLTPLTVEGLTSLTLDLVANDTGAKGGDTLGVSAAGVCGAGRLLLEASGGANAVSLAGGSSELEIARGTVTLAAQSPAVAGVTVSGTAVANLAGGAPLRWLRLNDAAVARVPAGGTLLRLGELAIAPGATLDLADNDLMVQTTAATRLSALSSITGWIQAARNAPGGLWAGKGLTSSAARAEERSGLALMLNDRGGGTPFVTSFRGQTVDANSILVGYRWNGDANLDGQLDADDYFRLDRGRLRGLEGYANGDFNYDGAVTAEDYQLIDAAFHSAGAARAAEPAIAVAKPAAAAAFSHTPIRARHVRKTVKRKPLVKKAAVPVKVAAPPAKPSRSAASPWPA